jgi:hypothetical protein
LDIVVLATTWFTVTVTVAETDPAVAVIVAVPLPLASVPVPDVVTNPPEDTVAILVFEEFQVVPGLEIVFPPESFTMGVTVAVSPNEANDSVLWSRVILAGVAVTTTSTVLLTDSRVTVTVAVPRPLAVIEYK